MSAPGRPFLALPVAEDRKAAFLLAVGFMALFYLFYGSASWMTGQYGFALRVTNDWTRGLPFVPWMSAIYLTVGSLMTLSIFVLREVPALKSLFRILMLQLLIGFVCFLLLPFEQKSPMPGLATDGFLFRFADIVNLERNEFPSLHVCFALTCALIMGDYGRWYHRLALVAWALAIALATLLIHEHYLMDVVAGMVMAAAGYRWWRVREGDKFVAAVSGAEP